MVTEKYNRKLTKLGLPDRNAIPKSNKCQKTFNLCKPRCKDCIWFEREKRYHDHKRNIDVYKNLGCMYPGKLTRNRNRDKINANSPACPVWNVLYFSMAVHESSRVSKFYYITKKNV